MRLAVIADIHGNLQALEAVLADIDRQGVDLVVVNGDMVNRGPNNVAVMERLAAESFVMTLGNHDDLLRKWIDRDADLPASWFGDPFWEGTGGWAARQLEQAGWMPRLRELPLTYRLELDGAPSVLISHGSPRHYREGYGRYLTDEALREITERFPADVLVGSHTHRALERRWGRHLILNTGAVGAPFDGDPRAAYLLLTLRQGAWRPEFRRLAYDREGALRAFRETGFLAEGGLGARIFEAELLYAQSFLTPFLMWTQREGLGLDEASWERFRRVFAERFVAPAPHPGG